MRPSVSPAPCFDSSQDDVLNSALNLFGAPLVMAIATGTWPSDTDSESSERPALDREGEERLRHALSIAGLLLEAEAPSTIRAWFVGRNPILGYQAPAIMIAKDPEYVHFAARDLAAHG